MTRYTPSDFDGSQIESTPVSQRVVRAVAAETDTDPIELDCLFDVIDPESLNALFESTKSGSLRTEGAVTFGYADCEVTVYASGDVDVDPNAPAQCETQRVQRVSTNQ